MKNKDIVQQIIKLYQSGMNYTEVGEELGLSPDMVTYRLKKEGIPKHSNVKQKDLMITRQMGELYHNNRMSLEEVGRRFGLTRNGVLHRFKVAGIPRRAKLKPIDKNVLEKLYTEDRLTTAEIAERFSVSITVIKTRLKIYKIPKRARIKNGGYVVDFLRSLDINQEKIFEYHGKHEFGSLHYSAKRVGIRIKTKKITPNKYAVTRIV